MTWIHGQWGGPAAAFPASSPPHAHCLRGGEVRGFVGEPRLADAGFSREEHESAAAGTRIVDRRAYLCELPLSAYEKPRLLMRFTLNGYQHAKRSWLLLLDSQRFPSLATLPHHPDAFQLNRRSPLQGIGLRPPSGRIEDRTPIALEGVWLVFLVA